MNNKKTVTLMVMATLCAGVCFARPHHGPGGFRGGHHRAPVVHHHHGHRHHHHGRAFVGGVVGGVVGVLLYNAVAPRPVVVAQPAPVVVTPAPVVVAQPAPVVQTTNVWVPGCYQDQVQANGSVVRVWVPGHYEQRTVVQ